MRLDPIIVLLKQLPLFDGVEPEALRILAFSATKRQFRPGDVLFRKGELSDGGFLILEGQIVYDTRDDGSPSGTVFGAGVLLGQNALFSPIERPATAIVRENAVVLGFSRDLIRKVLEVHPQSAAILRQRIQMQAQDMVHAVSGVEL